MDSAEADVLAAFDGTTVTLEQKAQYLLRFPLDVIELRIKSRLDSIMNPHQENIGASLEETLPVLVGHYARQSVGARF